MEAARGFETPRINGGLAEDFQTMRREGCGAAFAPVLTPGEIQQQPQGECAFEVHWRRYISRRLSSVPGRSQKKRCM